MIKTEYETSVNLNTQRYPSASHTGNSVLTIALITDLHEHNPAEVLEILRDAKPDVIAVAGDTMERHEYGENLDKGDRSIISRLICKGIHLVDKLAGVRQREKRDVKKENSYRFLMEGSKIAPVVMSLGNHELYLTDEDKKVISDAGVNLLENDAVEINGVLFGGLTSKTVTGEMDMGFLERFASFPQYKVLLCHHPEYYPQLQSYSIDLILSGHCHGGQIRVCGRGIFAPGQGILPRYHHGVYDNRLVVSAGCANTASIPRWGNETEVVIVRLKP